MQIIYKGAAMMPEERERIPREILNRSRKYYQSMHENVLMFTTCCLFHHEY